MNRGRVRWVPAPIDNELEKIRKQKGYTATQAWMEIRQNYDLGMSISSQLFLDFRKRRVRR